MDNLEEMRPQKLVVLSKKPFEGGQYLLGMYEIETDVVDPDLRRFKLWEERPNELTIHNQSVRCNPEEPLRVKHGLKAIYVRRLNPGGLVNRMNREDHLVWWAACVPSLAGSDPSSLRDEALSRGYSTGLIENQEVLQIPLPR
mgnify:CR=1 FL=1